MGQGTFYKRFFVGGGLYASLQFYRQSNVFRFEINGYKYHISSATLIRRGLLETIFRQKITEYFLIGRPSLINLNRFSVRIREPSFATSKLFVKVNYVMHSH